jgi:predicted amidohydrolase
MPENSQLSLSIIQSRRTSSWRETLNNVFLILQRSREHIGTVLFMNENWLSRTPIDITDYEYSVEKLGEEFGRPIFAGTNYIKEKKGAKSVGLFFDGGKIRRICEKVFPSKAVGERKHVNGGRILPPAEVSNWKISCIACVDIFYPEISRIHTLLGAHILYNPASITSDRISLWHSVLLTRAAENTVFTVGVNSVGYVYPDGRVTLGRSAVFAPNGIEVGIADSREGVFTFTLDLEIIHRIRDRWAFYDDLKNILVKYAYKEVPSLIGSTPLAMETRKE